MNVLAEDSRDLKETLFLLFQKLAKSASYRQRKLKSALAHAVTELKNEKLVLLNADGMFKPLKLACETEVPRIVEIALEGIQRLCENGDLVGDKIIAHKSSSGRGLKPTRLIDLLVQTVCDAGAIPNYAVNLSVIKVLLTLIQSPNCAVHENSLMLVMRTIYHMYLTCNTADIKTSAKATLIQITNMTFQRMEKATIRHKMFDDKPTETEDGAKLLKSHTEHHQMRLIVQQSINRAVEMAMGETKKEEEVGGKFGACVCCGKPANHFCLQTSSPIFSMECKIANLQNFLETLPPGEGSGHKWVHTKISISLLAAQLQNDAYLLLRAICKLSHKSLSENDVVKGSVYNPRATSFFNLGPFKLFESGQSDPVALKSKILSLELLDSIFENAGPTFRTSRRFIEAVRHHLIPVLTANAMSEVERIFKLSTKIFSSVLKAFRRYLKKEIGVLLDQVWLGIAESVNATFKQKLAAVEVFGMICINPELPVAIFFNYDCAKDDRCDLFARIIRFLERILKHKQGDRGDEFISPSQDQALKRASTHVFVMIMQRISTWVGAALRTNSGPESPKKGVNLEKVNTEAASKFMENYAERQREKQTIQDGIVKFNMNPKKGMKWLINMGLVEDTVESRVNFLLSNTLDKGQIGEYLGVAEKGEEMNLYITSIDFSDCTIDEGLRRLSYQFRLPGEGQKIDRIMQKFAERYCLQNPNIFAEADDAYVLAYSTIMLNVSLHNPKVKDPMTMESFVKVNKSIIDSPSMDGGKGEEMLEGIFERIKATEIMLEKPKNMDEETRSVVARYRSFVLERKAIIENVNSEVLLSRVNARRNSFYEPIYADLPGILPMFDIVWLASLSTFGYLLEFFDDPKIVGLCLEGYRLGIRISASLGKDFESNAYVTSLANVTLLNKKRSQILQKNIEAIKVLIDIAINEGNILGSSWHQVIVCISQLEVMHLMQRSAVADATHFMSKSDQKRANPDWKRGTDGVLRFVQNPNAQAVCTQVDPTVVDRLFAHTSGLDRDAIVQFCRHLCEVSALELASPKNPRVFCLRKIVEVAHYNINRIPLDWMKIWEVLGSHFAKAGCHMNAPICMEAINGLRQLAILFLQKQELRSFQFQNKFLTPFYVIMSDNENTAIRCLILECLVQTIQANITNVQSGWRTVFSVLGVGARSRSELVVTESFAQAEVVLKIYFSLLRPDTEQEKKGGELRKYLVKIMDNCAGCLVSFGKNQIDEECSLKAIGHLSDCSKYLLEDRKKKLEQVHEPDPTASGVEPRVSTNAPRITNSEPVQEPWLFCLAGLSELVGDLRGDVRTNAKDKLFLTLLAHGDSFDTNAWELVFKKVIVPIFDNALHSAVLSGGKIPEVSPEENIWLDTMALPCLSAFMEIFATFYNRVKHLVVDLMKVLTAIIAQPRENIAKIGIRSWRKFIEKCSHSFTHAEWDIVTKLLADTVSATIPNLLLSEALWKQLNVSGEDKVPVVSDLGLVPAVLEGRARIQALLIFEIRTILLTQYKVLNVDHYINLLSSVKEVSDFTSTFNTRKKLRRLLHKAGWRPNKLAPEFYAQEQSAVHCQITVALFLYCGYHTPNPSFGNKQSPLKADKADNGMDVADKPPDTVTDVPEKLKLWSKDQVASSAAWLLESFYTAHKERDLEGLRHKQLLICFLLEAAFNFWTPSQHKAMYPLFPLLINLIECESEKVRDRVAQLFRHLSTLHLLTTNIDK